MLRPETIKLLEENIGKTLSNINHSRILHDPPPKVMEVKAKINIVLSHCGEGGTLQTNNTGLCSKCLSHTGPAPAHGPCALPVHTAQALGCSTGNRRRLALGSMHLPGLSHSGSGTWVVLRGADSVGPEFGAFPRSKQAQVMRCLASVVTVTYPLPRPCRSVFWVNNRRTFSGGC